MGFWIFSYEFLFTAARIAPFDMLLSLRPDMCYIFCTDGFSRIPRVRCWRYDPYQRVALGGFSTPYVGSTQHRWLHHPTDLRGGRVWALRCSTLQGDHHCATAPGPRRLVWLELRIPVFPWAWVCRVSHPSGVDGLLRPQPYNSGSLSVLVVSSYEPTRPGVAGSYGPPLGAAFASWAAGRHSDADALPQRLVHTPGATLHHCFGDRSAFGDS
jgi:hypothetical protein